MADDYTESQYDDDLTLGAEDYYNDFSTDGVDLFEFGGDDDSPIARLKSIVLSIDWEITDDILQQLNEELIHLQDVWADDKIKLVYVQGLGKIGKYIFKEKASSHPNAIKLLLTFYYNLEKIVSSQDMSDEAMKQTLIQDVKKFDQLKVIIEQQQGGASAAAKPAAPAPSPPPPPEEKPSVAEPAAAEEPAPAFADVSPADTDISLSEDSPLTTMKALILGIDWEVNDKDLESLGAEVRNLETTYAGSKTKLVLLQGVGALTTYITNQKASSDAEAFKLLRSFSNSLDKITADPDISVEKEKEIVLTEVARFNDFKSTISAPPVPAKEEPAPAFAEASGDDQPSGFQGESEVDSDIEGFFSAESEDEVGDEGDEDEGLAEVHSKLDAFFADEEDAAPSLSGDVDVMEGVAVETEADDDSGEEALPFDGGEVAPALADSEGEQSAFRDDEVESEGVAEAPAPSAPATPAPALEEAEGDTGDSIMAGVEVETEADDDSDEEALPFEDGELAPALSGSPEDAGFSEETVKEELEEEESGGDLENRLDSFFGPDQAEEDKVSILAEAGEQPETSADQEADVAPALFEEDEEPAPALMDEEEPAPALMDEEEPAPALMDEEEPAPALMDEEEPAPALMDEEEVAPALMDAEEPAPALMDEEEVAPALMDEEEAAAPLFGGEEPEAAAPADEFEGVEDIESLLAEDGGPDIDIEEQKEEPLEEIFAEAVEKLDAEAPKAEEDILPGEVVQEVLFTGEEEVEPEEAATISAVAAIGGVAAGVAAGAHLGGEPEPVEAPEEEISFTVPGGMEEESVIAPSAAVYEAGGDDEEIEFSVPGDSGPLAGSGEVGAGSEDVLFEAVGDDVPVDPVSQADELQSLHGSVAAMAGGVDTGSREALTREIDQLQARWARQPEKKMLLQLLSTVTGNMAAGMGGVQEQEGVQLLQSISRQLDQCCRGTMNAAGQSEALLEATGQVLQFQQKRIDDAGKPPVQLTDIEGGSRDAISEVVRQEIKELRQAMQGELEELRRQISGS